MAKKWRAPNNPTGPAKQVWKVLFPHEPWPHGLTVKWAGWMRGAMGLAIGTAASYRPIPVNRRFRFHPHLQIILSYGDAKKWGTQNPTHGCVATLAHEFLHIRGYKKHGPEFYATENRLLRRLGIAPRVRANNGTAIDPDTGRYARTRPTAP